MEILASPMITSSINIAGQMVLLPRSLDPFTFILTTASKVLLTEKVNVKEATVFIPVKK